MPLSDAMSFLARFQSQIEQNPAVSAVIWPGGSWSYGELGQTSARVAARIASVTRGDEVVLILLRSPAATVASMVGAARAGRKFVVVDPTSPPERIRYILEDCCASTVLVDETTTIELDESIRAIPYSNAVAENDFAPGALLQEGHPVAIAYTSGSTGWPRGTVFPGSLFLVGIGRPGGIPEPARGERHGLLASLSFAAALPHVFGTLASGATLAVCPLRDLSLAALAEWISRDSLTHLLMPTSLFRHLMQSIVGDLPFPSVRGIKFMGEATSRRDVEVFQSRFDRSCHLWVGYGGTELGPVAGMEIRSETEWSKDAAPAGYPRDGVIVEICDDEGRPLPPGEVGQIVVSREDPPQWLRPIGDERRKPDPDRPGYWRLETDDRGRLRNDGVLEITGRRDLVLKIRGNRVEPFEIERALMEETGVENAVVLGRQNDIGDTEIIAFVTTTGADVSHLSVSLRQKLPLFMIPASIHVLDEMPTLPSGKVDRRRLQSTSLPAKTRKHPINPPSDEIETYLHDLWVSELGIEAIGRDEDFFELGGNSLKAAHIFGSIERSLNRTFSLSVLLESPTIARLARRLREQPDDTFEIVVPMRTGGTRPPLFCVAGGAGNVLGYHFLSTALGDDHPVYGLQSPFLRPEGARPATVEESAAVFLDAIRTVQPEGPYHLLGTCIGGDEVLEISRLMQARGERAALVVLVDSFARTPSWRILARDVIRYLNAWRHPLRDVGPLLREFARRIRTRRRYGEMIGPAIFGEDIPARSRESGLARRDAMAHLRRRTYDGRIAVFAAIDGIKKMSAQDDLGWSARVHGELIVREVPGDHISVLAPPNVERVAQELAELMRLSPDP